MSEEGRSQVSLPHRTQKSPFKSIEVKALLETHIDFIFAHNIDPVSTRWVFFHSHE